MSYKQQLDNIANELQDLIISNGDGVEIFTEDYGWKNKRYVGSNFRIAHIERYSDANLEVLHFTCFPDAIYQHPIFGFDIITTEKKPLAAFMDWSPVDNSLGYKPKNQFEKQYPLPEWAKLIFSSTPLAIVPNDEEMPKLGRVVIDSFTDYLETLLNSKSNPDRTQYIIAAQNRYCENQQKNERTYNVLKAKLGQEKAKYFMETILFPKIV
jgi:phycocyanobilin:ferredoxin oxidoreductase